jgi:MerR family mercuric resistance operon transcriptional regulator
MRVGELAKKTGCHLETIRYYERIGLMPSPPRSLSGYRQYTTEDVERLNFIVGSRALGFHLDEVRSLLRLASEPTLSCAEVDTLAREHLSQINDKQRELAALASELQAMIEACGQASRGQCTVLRSLGRCVTFTKRRLRDSAFISNRMG